MISGILIISPQATLTYSEATKDELIKKYSKDLETQISRLLDDLKTLKDEVPQLASLFHLIQQNTTIFKFLIIKAVTSSPCSSTWPPCLQVRHSNVLADEVSASVALQTIVNYHKTYEKYSDMAHKFMDYQARFGSSGRADTSNRFIYVVQLFYIA